MTYATIKHKVSVDVTLQLSEIQANPRVTVQKVREISQRLLGLRLSQVRWRWEWTGCGVGTDHLYFTLHIEQR